MKKLVLFFTLISFYVFASAQSLEESRKSLYYERYPIAASISHDLIKQNPQNGEAWYLLTRAFIQQNNIQQAKDTLNAAPAAIQSDPWYQVAKGYVLLMQDNKAEASALFNKALDETRHKNAGILSAVALAHIDAKSGDANYAKDLLERAIKRDRDNALQYVWLGNAYRKMNNGSEAYKAYQKALDKDDKLAAAHYQLGKIFVTQKDVQNYLNYFKKAIAVDPQYGPAHFELYYHFFPIDVAMSMDYYRKYMAAVQRDLENDYSYTDLLYLNKQYDEAIRNATKLMESEPDSTQARLYKLIAYSHQGLGDTATALSFMQEYFRNQADTNFVVKDFETMADLYASVSGKEDSAMIYYEKAAAISKDSAEMFRFYDKLATLAKAQDDHAAEARWLEKKFVGNKDATNLDLFNWGLAHYRAEDFNRADSVFGLYVQNYPDQSFGYYWRARSNVALDSAMMEGLAIPHYNKLIDIIRADTTKSIDSLSETDKRWLIEAYGYLAAYEANTKKDYQAAIDYFRKLLELDPGNEDAEKYIAILEKSLADDRK